GSNPPGSQQPRRPQGDGIVHACERRAGRSSKLLRTCTHPESCRLNINGFPRLRALPVGACAGGSNLAATCRAGCLVAVCGFAGARSRTHAPVTGGGSVAAADARHRLFPDGQSVHCRVLDNGLTVLVRRDDSAPVAAVVTLVKAGYFNEADRVSGVSHVLEHMYFKGTPSRAVGEIARDTRATGGYLNAY